MILKDFYLFIFMSSPDIMGDANEEPSSNAAIGGNEELSKKFNYRYIVQALSNPITARILGILISAIFLAIALATGTGIVVAAIGLGISVVTASYGIIADIRKYKIAHDIKSADKKVAKLVEKKLGNEITYVKDISGDIKMPDNYLLTASEYKEPKFSHFQNDLMKVFKEVRRGDPDAKRYVTNLFINYGPEILLPLATIPLTFNPASAAHAATTMLHVIGSASTSLPKLFRAMGRAGNELDIRHKNANKVLENLGKSSSSISKKEEAKNIAIEMQKQYEIAKINEIIKDLYEQNRSAQAEDLKKAAIDKYHSFGGRKNNKNIPFYIGRFFQTNFYYPANVKFRKPVQSKNKTNRPLA